MPEGAHSLQWVEQKCKFSKWVKDCLDALRQSRDEGAGSLRVSLRMPVAQAGACDVKATCTLKFMSLRKCAASGGFSIAGTGDEKRSIVVTIKLNKLH